MEFYKILTEILEEKNLSVAEAARACGLTDSTLRSVVQRKAKNVSLDVAFKISDGLGVSLYRLNGMPDPETDEKKAAISEAFSRLNADNQAKLLELSDLYLTSQRKSGEN